MIYTEARFYKTGWSFRVGVFNLRYNKQQNYTELTLGRVKPGYLSSGGLTWREFRLARKQAAAAVAEARKNAIVRAA